jgi:hypothetical protein
MIQGFSGGLLRNTELFYLLDLPTFQRDFAQFKTLDHATGPNITFTRASGATFFDADGVLQTAANNAPRFDHDSANGESRGLLIEEQRTNSIRNSQAGGAVVGTPGTLPTNWTASIQTGLTREIVATGTVNGMSYVDIRISGTAASTVVNAVHFETTTQVAALQNETWTTSASVALVGGTLANVVNVGIGFTETDSAGVAIVSSLITGFTPTATLARYSGTRTLTNASTAFYRPNVRFAAGNTVDPIDFTLRIAAPQLEQGAFATSYIPTTAAAATRAADSAVVTPISSFYNQAQGTLFGEWDPIADLLPTGAAQVVLDFNDQTVSNVLSLFALQGATKASQNVFSAGSNYGRIDAGGEYSGATVKAATATASADRALSVNGSSSQTSSASVMPVSVTHFNIGSRVGTLFANSHIRKVAYWPKRLSNTLLEQLTT